MKVYISPVRLDVSEIDASYTYVFLAGGISKCWDWQDRCCELIQEIAKIKEINTDKLILFNPRRLYFDTANKSASDEQIKWEYTYLNICDIFSMYFCESDSVQPICLYELGHYIPSIMAQYSKYYKALQHIVVTAESKYARCYDVEKQLELDLGVKEKRMIFDKNEYSEEAIRSHAYRILDAYESDQLNKKIDYAVGDILRFDGVRWRVFGKDTLGDGRTRWKLFGENEEEYRMYTDDIPEGLEFLGHRDLSFD